MPDYRKARRVAIALAASALFVVVAESALRLAGFSYAERETPLVIWTGKKAWEFDKHDSLHARDPDMLWVPKAGVELPWSPGEHVNTCGLRGPELALARTPGVLRIATLGDSSTFGLGVAWDDCWTARLGRELERRGIANEVLCGGVIAYSACQGLERYRSLVRTYRPDIVIAGFGALNEHWSALGESDAVRVRESQRANTPGRRALRSLRNSVRTVQAVSYLVDWSTGRLVEGRRSQAAVEASHAQAPDAGRIDWEGTRRVDPEELSRILSELRREVAADGGALILINMPRRPRAERTFPVLAAYTEAVEAVAAREGISIFDARAAFRTDEGGEDLFLEHDAVHPSVAGHARIAQGLAPLVEKMLPTRGMPDRDGGTEQ